MNYIKRKMAMVAVCLLAVFGTVQAQTLPDTGLLHKKEDSLKIFAREMINALDGKDRYEASQHFIPQLVDALKIPHSFRYPFDSLREVSITYPPDSSFRIFTWAITTNQLTFRFYGALQINTPGGRLKLYPFFDNTQFTHDMDTITSNKAWIGALYYKILLTQHAGKKFYTLFGWHGYDFRSNQKLLDVLTFKNGQPVFGAPIFNFGNDSVPGKTRNRFILIYKRDGNASLNYDPDKKMIVFDHLASLNGRPEEKYTLVPDGTYEGFKWENGYWVHVSKVYHSVSAKPPLPAPVQFKKNILEKQIRKEEDKKK